MYSCRQWGHTIASHKTLHFSFVRMLSIYFHFTQANRGHEVAAIYIYAAYFLLTRSKHGGITKSEKNMHWY